MFLFGQGRHPSANKYFLVNEVAIQGDLVQGSQIDSYHDLKLKVQMGIDFVLLLKAHDDLFINPFTLIAQLKSSKTPKSKLYLGNCSPKREYRRGKGKWALSYRAEAKILLRSSIYFISLPCTSFCRGI